jgi:multiple antibiotic resistance protein
MDQKLLQDAITLLVVINPIGAAPLYLALTRGMERRGRLAVARRACVIAAIILIAFIAIGEIVLDGMGVNLPAFRTAGGLVLLLVGLRMVLGNEGPAAAQDQGGARDVAVFPLATPLLAGPGAIIAAVLLTENDRFGIADQAVTAGVVVAIFVLTYGILAGADFLQKAIGNTGATVMSRVLGLVLTALAMQTMLDGLKPYLMSLR